MDYRIIADSCCDMTPELQERLGVITVPLSMTLGERSIVDDETLDLPRFMVEMKNCTDRIGSAAPSPTLYQEAFQQAQAAFVVTLSSNLSASYANAILGKTMAEEEGAEVHVFDSKSASAGEVLVVLKIRRMIDAGFHKATIIAAVEDFIREMKTYFVLDNIENLLKNGRLNKVVGKLICLLNIKPVMGADDDGHIALYDHARGQNQIIRKLADTIEKSGKHTEGESLVITHCQNPGLAERLKETIQNRYHFQEILIVPTRGLSSTYANSGGIVMAF